MSLEYFKNFKIYHQTDFQNEIIENGFDLNFKNPYLLGFSFVYDINDIDDYNNTAISTKFSGYVLNFGPNSKIFDVIFGKSKFEEFNEIYEILSINSNPNLGLSTEKGRVQRMLYIEKLRNYLLENNIKAILSGYEFVVLDPNTLYDYKIIKIPKKKLKTSKTSRTLRKRKLIST